HGDWNYTLHPRDYDQAAGVPDPFDQPSPDLAWLCHPALTGLPEQDWDALMAALMMLHDQQRETNLDKRRGHRPRLTAPGTRPPPAGPAPRPRRRTESRPAASRHRHPVRRPPRHDQQAHPRHPPAPGPGRIRNRARLTPPDQPG